MLILGTALQSADVNIADVLAKLPAMSADDGQPLLDPIIKGGAPAVGALCKMIQAPGKGDDSKARFALHGIVLYTKRPGSEADRKMVECTLLEGLNAAEDKDLKAFFVEQLRWIGSEDCLPAMAKLLPDDQLCEHAAFTLQEIGTPAAVAKLREALGSAKGKNIATLVRALGVLRDKESAKAIAALVVPASAPAGRDAGATPEDVALRRCALFALANVGDATATDALIKATNATTVYERSHATDCLLLLARRLIEDGQKDAGVKIARDLLKTRGDPQDGNVQCAILSVLTKALGEGALDDLFTAVEGKNVYVRWAALNLLQTMPGSPVTEKVLQKAKGSSGEVLAAYLTMLGRRGDKAAVAQITEALQNAEEAVMRAAATALVKLDPAAAGAAIAKASPVAKTALLELLASRAAADQAGAILQAAEDSEEKVRVAAITALSMVAGPNDLSRVLKLVLEGKTPNERTLAGSAVIAVCRRTPESVQVVLDGLAAAKDDAHVTLLQTLSRLGGAKAQAAVLADCKNADEKIQDAAIRALADWQDPAGAPELLNVAKSASKEPQKVLLIRGYTRLASMPNIRPPAESVAMFKSVLEIAGPAEKKGALSGLGGIRSEEALKLVSACLDDPALAEEASAAAVRIACPVDAKDKGMHGPIATEALEKVLKASKNEALLTKAKKQLGK
jgi:HEAT repeat protein